MAERKELEALFEQHGLTDYKWVNPKDIVVGQWVRMKCMYGCRHYGRAASCPPNVPSVVECRQFFDEYDTVAVFHFRKAFENPDDRGPWAREVNRALLKLERDVFLAGHEKAFLLFMDSCRICEDCASFREDCKDPRSARPSPEALGVDVYSTVRQYGYPIQVLTDYSQAMNRYAFLLIV